MIPSLTLFVHIVGMLTLFVGLALEWASLDGLQRSITRDQAVPWLRLVGMVPRVSGIAVAAIVLSGLYLGARIGVLGNDWMRASYGALLLMAIVGGPVSRSSMRALKRVADAPADGTVALQAAAANPILRLSLRIRIACGLAIVFLMIAKPAAGESLLVLALAAMVTIATSLTRDLREPRRFRGIDEHGTDCHGICDDCGACLLRCGIRSSRLPPSRRTCSTPRWTSDWVVGSPIVWTGEWQGRAYEDRGVILQIVRERVLEFSYFSPLAGAADLPENYHIVTVHVSSDGAQQTRVSLHQDNNLTDEARGRAERNWSVMLAGLKHFVEHNRGNDRH